MSKLFYNQKHLLAYSLTLGGLNLFLVADKTGLGQDRQLEILIVVVLSIALPAVLIYQWLMRKTIRALRETVLQTHSEIAELAKESSASHELLMKGNIVLGDLVARKFDEWEFSSAEKEIGIALLRGDSNKIIASKRGTTDHTVRQQESSLYKKCGLHGRSEFSAFFLTLLLDLGEYKAK